MKDLLRQRFKIIWLDFHPQLKMDHLPHLYLAIVFKIIRIIRNVITMNIFVVNNPVKYKISSGWFRKIKELLKFFGKYV